MSVVNVHLLLISVYMFTEMSGMTSEASSDSTMSNFDLIFVYFMTQFRLNGRTDCCEI